MQNPSMISSVIIHLIVILMDIRSYLQILIDKGILVLNLTHTHTYNDNNNKTKR